jgi:2-methylcitrate dehydratase PrpD
VAGAALAAGDLAGFAVGLAAGDLSPAAAGRVRDAIRDCVAVAVAGSAEPVARAVRETIEDGGGAGGTAYLFGTDRRAGVTDAALHNGVAAHALDYDDTARPAFGHLSAALVPTLLALEERSRSGGAELLASYAAGFEVAARLADRLNLGHYQRGWHATATLGTVAAAAAGARLLRLPVATATHALGIAASAAGGLRVNFGTMTKPLHAGFAARNGVLACLLAARGVTASDSSLDGEHGFLDLFGGAPDAPGSGYPSVARFLDQEWSISLKPYPSCGATHAAIEAALAVRERCAGQEVTEVTVGGNALSRQVLRYDRPATPLEARFSMPYCVATALVHGRVGLASFAPAALDDPRVTALVGRVRFVVADDLRSDPDHPGRVTVRTAGGELVEELVPRAKGRRGRPLSEPELAAKFSDCATGGWGAARAARAFAALGALGEPGGPRRLRDVLEER